MKKKEENNKDNLQSQVKLRRQSSAQNLKKNQESKPRNQSPVKKVLNPPSPDKTPPEPKPEEEKKKKPKVETRDACT